MIRHDLTHWPLVLSNMSGPMTLEEQLAFFAAWTGWLDRGERFATLRVFADVEALRRPEGGAKEAKAWLQTNAERVKAQVMSMATVVPVEAYNEVSRMNAEKLFGVPAQTFARSDEAVAWIVRLLAEANIELKPDAVHERLGALTRSV